MARNKGGFGALLLAGAAAFAYYKYSKMSEEQKNNLVGSIKEKGRKYYDEGKKFYDENVASNVDKVTENVKTAFSKKEGETAQNGYTHG